jgi:serine phosphatase RsbU (regulator of sigma subunit)
MTLISVGALALIEVPEGNVADLMQRVHQLVQITVNQHVDSGESDDGMELGICYLYPDRGRMTYTGARFSLFVVENGDVKETKGDRSGIGYRNIPHDQAYSDSTIDLVSNQSFYLTSDGLIDQVGGERRRSFGKRRFKNLVRAFQDVSFDRQREAVIQALRDHQGEQLRRDDVAVMGFEVS